MKIYNELSVPWHVRVWTRLTLKAEHHKLICLLLNDTRLLIIYLYVPCSCTDLESFLRKSPSSIGTTFCWVTMSCSIFQLLTVLTNQKHAYDTYDTRPKTNMEPWKIKLWNRRFSLFQTGWWFSGSQPSPNLHRRGRSSWSSSLVDLVVMTHMFLDFLFYPSVIYPPGN